MIDKKIQTPIFRLLTGIILNFPFNFSIMMSEEMWKYEYSIKIFKAALGIKEPLYIKNIYSMRKSLNSTFMLILGVAADFPVPSAVEKNVPYTIQRKKYGVTLISFSTNVTFISETRKSNVTNAAWDSLCRIGHDRKADLHLCLRHLYWLWHEKCLFLKLPNWLVNMTHEFGEYCIFIFQKCIQTKIFRNWQT